MKVHVLQLEKVFLFERGDLMSQGPAFSGLVMLQPRQMDQRLGINSPECISNSTSLTTPQYHNIPVLFELSPGSHQGYPSPIFRRIKSLLSSHQEYFSLTFSSSRTSCHHFLLCPTTGGCCAGGDEKKRGEGKEAGR